MFLQTFAPLLPLAQAAEPLPSPSTIAARLIQSFFADPRTQTALINVLLALALGVVIKILSCWIASKVVAAEGKSTFPNALKLWLLSILVGVAFVLLLAIAIGFAFFINQNIVAICLFGGWFLLAIIASFLLPMRIYDLGFFRALAFLIMAAIVSIAGQTAVNRTLHVGGIVQPAFLQQIKNHPPDDFLRFLRQVLGGATDPLDVKMEKLDSPEERTKAFPDRQAALKDIYTDLEARFKSLPPDDASALENYQRLRTRYEKLLTQLREDYAASQGAVVPAAP